MFALRIDPSVTDTDKPAAVSELEDRVQSGRAIVCAACGAAITSTSHLMAINGVNEHRFVNPTGFLFHIGCFAYAVGCIVVGPDSLEYPWFPGFAWRFAMCGSCGRHLGWHFRKHGYDGFFGLILNRLVVPTADD